MLDGVQLLHAVLQVVAVAPVVKGRVALHHRVVGAVDHVAPEVGPVCDKGGGDHGEMSMSMLPRRMPFQDLPLTTQRIAPLTQKPFALQNHHRTNALVDAVVGKVHAGAVADHVEMEWVGAHDVVLASANDLRAGDAAAALDADVRSQLVRIHGGLAGHQDVAREQTHFRLILLASARHGKRELSISSYLQMRPMLQ